MLSAHKIDEVPISIHMRRSDYLMPAQLRFHGLCAASYYQEAVGLTVEKVEKPFFYIFSDSPDEAEKVFPSLMQRYKIVSNMENNEPETDILELGAMRDCKHQIIANSSFSWWGAWLSETFPGKIVIAPRKWYVTSTLSQSPADAMKHWKKI